MATSCEELTHWKTPWCWEGLGAGGEGDDREWDGWMVNQLDGREFEWTPGVGDGQGGLACCNSWGRKESDTTERLNWTESHVCCSKSSYVIYWLTALNIYSLWNMRKFIWHGSILSKISSGVQKNHRIVHSKIEFFRKHLINLPKWIESLDSTFYKSIGLKKY